MSDPDPATTVADDRDRPRRTPSGYLVPAGRTRRAGPGPDSIDHVLRIARMVPQPLRPDEAGSDRRSATGAGLLHYHHAIAHRGNTVVTTGERPGRARGTPPGADAAGPPVARWRRAPAWWPILVPLVIVLVGAWTYRWVDEDAFIDFRVIHNLLAGYGPVFNVGERVEVDSDPLWMFTLAAHPRGHTRASLEWTSVVLGLVCTAGGFVCRWPGRGAPRGPARRGDGAAASGC